MDFPSIGLSAIFVPMDQAQVITLYRPTLQSIAVSMLGCLADAEDVVQDTFLKWMTIDNSKIQNVKAFLVRSVINNCINFIKKSKKALCDELSEDVLVEGVDHLPEEIDVERKIQHAWSLINFKLAPVERAVYVLREAFNLEYEDLQHIVDKSSDNCRQLFSRAKAKINEEVPKIHLEMPSIKLPATFRNACSLGQLSDLIADFKLEIPGRKK